MVVDVAADLPPISGDRDRLIQVVINLISNAVKFTPSGSITCSAHTAPEGGSIVVSVADTGVGIAPEDQARVFEQFGQAGDTLTDKPRGTGLGLPICREIVEHHGGRLWLESVVGRGSVFSFSLPLVDAPAHGVGVAAGAPESPEFSVS
jgi:signal transduction histidine kinase